MIFNAVGGGTGSESGTSAATNCVEDHESLETGALVSEFSQAVEYKVNDFLSDGVVSSCEVVSCIFLATSTITPCNSPSSSSKSKGSAIAPSRQLRSFTFASSSISSLIARATADARSP